MSDEQNSPQEEATTTGFCAECGSDGPCWPGTCPGRPCPKCGERLRDNGRNGAPVPYCYSCNAFENEVAATRDASGTEFLSNSPPIETTHPPEQPEPADELCDYRPQRTPAQTCLQGSRNGMEWCDTCFQRALAREQQRRAHSLARPGQQPPQPPETQGDPNGHSTREGGGDEWTAERISAWLRENASAGSGLLSAEYLNRYRIAACFVDAVAELRGEVRDQADPITDAHKARWYLDRLIKQLEADQ